MLGAGYSQEIHFIGHSLGTLVNAAAANFLHGDRTAQQAVSATLWSPTRTHLTLLDAAESAAGLEVKWRGMSRRKCWTARKQPGNGFPAALTMSVRWPRKVARRW